MDDDLANVLTSVTVDIIPLHSKPPSVPALENRLHVFSAEYFMDPILGPSRMNRLAACFSDGP